MNSEINPSVAREIERMRESSLSPEAIAASKKLAAEAGDIIRKVKENLRAKIHDRTR